ncbi:MAG: haloacid dehalogenase, partial [Candidatus Dormibacteraeota bacterium]|nr:haloacid dehalogenase [Candidatus Dormibacteraeota bacterium]
MTAIDISAFEVLTFDCYGTLIDWERGLLAALR